MYLSRCRENMPCHWPVLVLYFTAFLCVDHIRALCALLWVMVLLPMHCNKRGNDAPRASAILDWRKDGIVLCSSQPGTHWSCTAVYMWCAATGITECLCLLLLGPVDQNFPRLVFVLFALSFLGVTVFMTALLIDNLLTPTTTPPSQQPPVHDVEAPAPPVKRSIVTSAPSD